MGTVPSLPRKSVETTRNPHTGLQSHLGGGTRVGCLPPHSHRHRAYGSEGTERPLWDSETHSPMQRKETTVFEEQTSLEKKRGTLWSQQMKRCLPLRTLRSEYFLATFSCPPSSDVERRVHETQTRKDVSRGQWGRADTEPGVAIPAA